MLEDLCFKFWVWVMTFCSLRGGCDSFSAEELVFKSWV